AAPVRRRRYAEQDERCRSDRHHWSRWTGTQQVGIDAPVRLYSQQVRDRGADCLYPPHLRSSLPCFRTGLCTEIGRVDSALIAFALSHLNAPALTLLSYTIEHKN